MVLLGCAIDKAIWRVLQFYPPLVRCACPVAMPVKGACSPQQMTWLLGIKYTYKVHLVVFRLGTNTITPGPSVHSLCCPSARPGYVATRHSTDGGEHTPQSVLRPSPPVSALPPQNRKERSSLGSSKPIICLGLLLGYERPLNTLLRLRFAFSSFLSRFPRLVITGWLK